MKKIVFIFIALLALTTARSVYASSDFITAGVLHFNPVMSGGPGTWYKGNFPDTSTPVAFPSSITTLQTLECGQICGAIIGDHYWLYVPGDDHYDEVTKFGATFADWSLVSQGSYSGSNATQFTSYTLSTTTQTFRVTGYVKSTDTDVHISFNVSTPLYSQWDHGDVVATTTYFDMSFPYQNFSTSTIDIFTFTSTLYTPASNPFDPNSNPTTYDTVSTTTNANGTGITSLPTPSEIDEAVAENCNPLSSFFNTASCVTYLFFPNPTEVANNTNTVRNKLLVKAPIGYFTRLYAILTTDGTTTIPVLSYTWASDGGPFSGKTLSFDVDDYMAQAKTLTNEMTSNTDHKTVWDILMPFVNIFLAVYVFYNIISDIMGLDLMTHRKSEPEIKTK